MKYMIRLKTKFPMSFSSKTLESSAKKWKRTMKLLRRRPGWPYPDTNRHWLTFLPTYHKCEQEEEQQGEGGHPHLAGNWRALLNPGLPSSLRWEERNWQTGSANSKCILTSQI